MHPALNRNPFLVKEHTGLFKAAAVYRLQGNDALHVDIRTPSEGQVDSVTRGVPIFLSMVKLLDEDDECIGGFSQKFFTIADAFRVLATNDHELCQLKLNWTNRDVCFTVGGNEPPDV